MKVLLHSGGIDSSALAFWLKPDRCVTVDYGQPAFAGEIRAAKSLCNDLGLQHEALQLPIYRVGPLSDGYWPLRNQLLLTAIAARFGNEPDLSIIIGVLKDDIYSDCGEEFIANLSALLTFQIGTVKIEAPALNLNCLELLERACFPKQYLSATFSCHRSDLPCGECRGCQKSAIVRRSRHLLSEVSQG